MKPLLWLAVLAVILGAVGTIYGYGYADGYAKRVAEDLAATKAANQRIADLERRLAARDREDARATGERVRETRLDGEADKCVLLSDEQRKKMSLIQ